MPEIANHHVSSNKSEHTVKDFIDNPTMIKKALSLLTENEFIAESLFQKGFNAAGGAVAYHESQYPFVNEMEDTNEDFAVAEGQEPHQVYQSDVGPQTARVKKYFIEGWVSFEEEEYNQLGALARLTERMRNTMIAKLDGATLNMLLTNSKVRNYTVSGGGDWTSPTYAGIYEDILNVKGMINRRASAGGTYRANTLVVNEEDYYDMLLNQGIKDYYKDIERPADAPYYTGSMGTLAGLNVMVTPWLPSGWAFMLQKNVIGGIADAKPLTVKPVERDEQRERYFIRMVRRTVAFLTDPGAIVRMDIKP